MAVGPERLVFVFQGLLADSANAVFTTKENAERWIAQHQLTGILSQFQLDKPPFDEWAAQQAERERAGHPTKKPRDPNRFADCNHWHYFGGKGESDPDFDQAQRDWEAEHRPGRNT